MPTEPGGRSTSPSAVSSSAAMHPMETATAGDYTLPAGASKPHVEHKAAVTDADHEHLRVNAAAEAQQPFQKHTMLTYDEAVAYAIAQGATKDDIKRSEAANAEAAKQAREYRKWKRTQGAAAADPPAQPDAAALPLDPSSSAADSTHPQPATDIPTLTTFTSAPPPAKRVRVANATPQTVISSGTPEAPSAPVPPEVAERNRRAKDEAAAKRAKAAQYMREYRAKRRERAARELALVQAQMRAQNHGGRAGMGHMPRGGGGGGVGQGVGSNGGGGGGGRALPLPGSGAGQAAPGQQHGQQGAQGPGGERGPMVAASAAASAPGDGRMQGVVQPGAVPPGSLSAFREVGVPATSPSASAAANTVLLRDPWQGPSPLAPAAAAPFSAPPASSAAPAASCSSPSAAPRPDVRPPGYAAVMPGQGAASWMTPQVSAALKAGTPVWIVPTVSHRGGMPAPQYWPAAAVPKGDMGMPGGQRLPAGALYHIVGAPPTMLAAHPGAPGGPMAPPGAPTMPLTTVGGAPLALAAAAGGLAGGAGLALAQGQGAPQLVAVRTAAGPSGASAAAGAGPTSAAPAAAASAAQASGTAPAGWVVGGPGWNAFRMHTLSDAAQPAQQPRPGAPAAAGGGGASPSQQQLPRSGSPAQLARLYGSGHAGSPRAKPATPPHPSHKSDSQKPHTPTQPPAHSSPAAARTTPPSATPPNSANHARHASPDPTHRHSSPRAPTPPTATRTRPSPLRPDSPAARGSPRSDSPILAHVPTRPRRARGRSSQAPAAQAPSETPPSALHILCMVAYHASRLLSKRPRSPSPPPSMEPTPHWLPKLLMVHEDQPQQKQRR